MKRVLLLLVTLLMSTAVSAQQLQYMGKAPRVTISAIEAKQLVESTYNMRVSIATGDVREIRRIENMIPFTASRDITIAVYTIPHQRYTYITVFVSLGTSFDKHTFIRIR
jgi:hypothetical protein